MIQHLLTLHQQPIILCQQGAEGSLNSCFSGWLCFWSWPSPGGVWLVWRTHRLCWGCLQTDQSCCCQRGWESESQAQSGEFNSIYEVEPSAGNSWNPISYLLCKEALLATSSTTEFEFFQVNLHIYGPQVIVASNTFCVDPTSKVAKETFENFADMWRYLVNDVIQVAKEILESFKSFSLLGTPATTPLKPSNSRQQHFNSVFQNRDPFTSSSHRNNINQASMYNNSRLQHPVINNINGSQQCLRPGSDMMPPPRRCNSAYMDRGHPDGMVIPGDGVRWQDEQRRPGAPVYPGQWEESLFCFLNVTNWKSLQ